MSNNSINDVKMTIAHIALSTLITILICFGVSMWVSAANPGEAAYADTATLMSQVDVRGLPANDISADSYAVQTDETDKVLETALGTEDSSFEEAGWAFRDPDTNCVYTTDDEPSENAIGKVYKDTSTGKMYLVEEAAN